MKQNFTFYDRFKDLVTSRNLTIARVESDLGLAKHHTSKWKNSLPSFKSLLMLADYFGVSVDYLLGRETSISASDADLLRKYHALTDVQREAIDGAIDGFLARNPSSKQEIS